MLHIEANTGVSEMRGTLASKVIKDIIEKRLVALLLFTLVFLYAILQPAAVLAQTMPKGWKAVAPLNSQQQASKGTPLGSYNSNGKVQYDNPQSKPQAEHELVEKRTADSETFVKSDGSMETKVYPNGQNYQKDGKWEQINTTLVE